MKRLVFLLSTLAYGQLVPPGGGGTGGNVVVTSSALPTGASTSALQTTGNTSLSNIDGKTPALVGGRVPVDGSGVTQPVSAVSLPLPTNAATSTKQSDGSQKTQIVDGAGNVIGATTNALDVNIKSGNPTTMSVTQGTSPWVVSGTVAATQSGAWTATSLLAAQGKNTQPSAVSDGSYAAVVTGLDGVLYMRQGGPVTWSCSVNSIAASLTQCQPAPGANLSLYITGLYVQTTTTTSGTYSLQSGTGSNCGTGTAAVFPSSGTANRFNAPITTSAMASIFFPVPIKVTANNALCLIGVATNTISAQIVGFTAP